MSSNEELFRRNDEPEKSLEDNEPVERKLAHHKFVIKLPLLEVRLLVDNKNYKLNIEGVSMLLRES
jgi:hypothetical protein